MYIPKHYEQKDREKLLDFMRAFPFAVMVSAVGEKPVGTHLPFVTEADEDTLFLYSHLSLAIRSGSLFQISNCWLFFRNRTPTFLLLYMHTPRMCPHGITLRYMHTAA